MRRPSFDRFGLALGGYVGVLAALAFAAMFDRGLSSRWSIVVGIAGFVAAWSVVAVGPETWPTIAEIRLHEALTLAPSVVLLGGLWLEEAAVTSESTIGIEAVLALGGLAVSGMAVQVVAERRRAARVEFREIRRAAWTATPGLRHRWYRRARSVALGLALLGGSVLVWSHSEFVATLVIGAAVSTGLRVLDVGDTEYLAAHESGLTVRDSMDSPPRFVPWSRFSGYERTDDALVLRRRLPLTGYRCGLDAIEDPDAVESTLRERLGA